ncbi:MAG: aspartate aminotransferase family protein [Actinomycetia bacterium]|nr:aspartate aminotransferase family protein [Actinomycetes bacterium]
MSGEEFRRHGHAVIDWIADYIDDVEQYPVESQVAPGDIRALMPTSPPEAPEAFEDILADVDRIVMPGITHWQSPNWFAFFPASSSAPAILGDLVSSGLGVQGMMWSTSPACTEVESVVMDWLVELLGLPEGWRTTDQGGGVLQMSASDSTHTALVVARHLANEAGHTDETLVAYTSGQAHSSIEKGAQVSGYGHVRKIDVDDEFALIPAALEATIAADREAGLHPTFVNSSVGTTATTAVDPVKTVGEIARREGLWHHVDAAFAGSAMICPEFRHHQDGLELVDSYVFNPHKWLLTNFDCSAFFVADRKSLLETLSILPAYLRNEATESGAVIDYRDWHVPLGRRFRALKLWFVLRSYGAEGLRAHIRSHVEMAKGFEQKVIDDPRFKLYSPTFFSLVCFRHVAGNDVTDTLAEAINATGKVSITRSEIDGDSFIRVAVGSTYTTQEHVDGLWELFDELAPVPAG